MGLWEHDIGDIVPGSGGYEYGGVCKDGLAEGQIVLGVAHLNDALAFFEAQELVVIGMDFEADVAAGGN